MNRLLAFVVSVIWGYISLPNHDKAGNLKIFVGHQLELLANGKKDDVSVEYYLFRGELHDSFLTLQSQPVPSNWIDDFLEIIKGFCEDEENYKEILFRIRFFEKTKLVQLMHLEDYYININN